MATPVLLELSINCWPFTPLMIVAVTPGFEDELLMAEAMSDKLLVADTLIFIVVEPTVTLSVPAPTAAVDEMVPLARCCAVASWLTATVYVPGCALDIVVAAPMLALPPVGVSVAL